MNINNNSVVIGNVSEVSTTTRRMAGLRSDRALATTSTLNIDYAVVLVMQSLGFQDADEAVSSLLDSIQGSVSSGEFLDILKEVSQTYSMDLFANAYTPEVTVTKVILSYNSPAPSPAPSTSPTLFPTAFVKTKSSSTNFLSSKETVIVIAVAVVAGVLGVLILSYIFLRGFKNPAKIISVRENT